MVNGHKSAAHTDLTDDGTGKTYLGGGMHCPSVSSLCFQCSSLVGSTNTTDHGERIVC